MKWKQEVYARALMAPAGLPLPTYGLNPKAETELSFPPTGPKEQVTHTDPDVCVTEYRPYHLRPTIPVT